MSNSKIVDVIVFKTVTKSGGIDGRDSSDVGGNVVGAFLSREEAEASSKGQHEIVPVVIQVDKVMKAAYSKLDPVEKLILGLPKIPTIKIKVPPTTYIDTVF